MRSPAPKGFYVRFVTKVLTNPDGSLKVSGTKGVGFPTLEAAQAEIRRGIAEDWRFAGWVSPSPMAGIEAAIWGTQREEAKCCEQPASHRMQVCPEKRSAGVAHGLTSGGGKVARGGSRSKATLPPDPRQAYKNHRTWHGCEGKCEEARRLEYVSRHPATRWEEGSVPESDTAG